MELENRRPVIGITMDSGLGSDNSYSISSWYAIRQEYASRIYNAGGIPILLPYLDNAKLIIGQLDGILISGGDSDIDPKHYGQEIKSSKVKINSKREKFEIDLVKLAISRNMPILGICNGMQLINILLGGTLIQHIPDQIVSNINHEQPKPKNIPTHKITIQRDTLLNTLTDEKTLMVNTTHHQAVDKLGKELRVGAVASDGIIEAIESIKHKFLIGVQWHAEYCNTNLDLELFKMLVEKCI